MRGIPHSPYGHSETAESNAQLGQPQHFVHLSQKGSFEFFIQKLT